MDRGNSAEVLVVEDEPLLRRQLVEILNEAGYEVIEASNGQEACERLCSPSHLAAIVTDVAMPGQVDGRELAWQAHKTHPDAAVIVISGHVRASPEELPPDACFLSKPLAARDLLRALHSRE